MNCGKTENKLRVHKKVKREKIFENEAKIKHEKRNKKVKDN